MNVAQYMAAYLAKKGVQDVFMLTGGGAMFLNDALAFQEGMRVVFCHHEQACSMAAEGYARVKGSPGVVNVTTGPGGINALNGVFGAFTDSIPMLVLSGQVKRATHLRATPVEGLRQLGDQEVDIVSMAAPVCKMAESVFDPLKAPAQLAKAWRVCQEGRPGPAWLDIPIDVQSSPLPDDLAQRGLAGEFDLEEGLPEAGSAAMQALAVARAAQERLVAVEAAKLCAMVAKAERPLMLWGTGVRLAGAQADLLAAAEALDCPVATAWTHDTIEQGHRLWAGRPGTIGTRSGNFALQSADLLLVLGSRLNVRQTSYNFESFAKNAKVVHVDIDPAEFRKGGIKPSVQVVADLRTLAPEMKAEAEAMAGAGSMSPGRFHWLEWIKARQERYPDLPPKVVAGQELRGDFVNPYAFVRALSEMLPERSVMACGNASACIVPFQCARLRAGMRLFSNSGSASMGYDLPAAVGAAVADPSRMVACLAGDGSIQLNIQELETVKRLNLNLKVVVLDNGGYLSIRSSQANFFGRLAGSSPESGVGFPDYVAVGRAYGLESIRIQGASWRADLAAALSKPGPALIHAMLDPEQGFEPRMSSRKLPDGRIVSPEIEDMHPFLDRDELARAMDPKRLDLP